jgi:hypothetical protein
MSNWETGCSFSFGGKMHDKKVKQIEEILAFWDPVKLIKMGAPLDEYAHEAQDIYERINRWNSVTRIQEIIYDVFVASFSGGVAYKSNSEGNLEPVGYVEPSKDKALNLIGTFESYKFAADAIKKVLEDE